MSHAESGASWKGVSAHQTMSDSSWEGVRDASWMGMSVAFLVGQVIWIGGGVEGTYVGKRVFK